MLEKIWTFGGYECAQEDAAAECLSLQINPSSVWFGFGFRSVGLTKYFHACGWGIRRSFADSMLWFWFQV